VVHTKDNSKHIKGTLNVVQVQKNYFQGAKGAENESSGRELARNQKFLRNFQAGHSHRKDTAAGARHEGTQPDAWKAAA